MKLLIKLAQVNFLLMGAPLLIGAQDSYAWGNRGHHEICAAATYLVKNETLKNFLRSKEHRMGLLCNIPDIYWRDLEAAQTSLGNPSHYINPEQIGQSLKSVNSNYKKLLAKTKIEAPHGKVGSLWWRADQFYRRAIEHSQKSTQTKSPKNIIEQQKRDLPFNRAVYEMHVNMGIMGHFVGDVSMPYHNQMDYDGWAAGRGGIHSIYEDLCFDTFDVDLKQLVVQEAQTLNKLGFLDSKKSVIERMRLLSLQAQSEVAQIESLDKILEASVAQQRQVAKRPPLQISCEAFRPLIVKQMARSAATLARFWDEIYTKGKRPKLDEYKSYEYPFTPDFVAPDYL